VYNAKRGIATACRPSLRLSICLTVALVDQGHIRWKSWSNSQLANTFALRTQAPFTYTPSETWALGKLWGDKRCRRKSGVLEHKSGSISETRKDRGKVTAEGL